MFLKMNDDNMLQKFTLYGFILKYIDQYFMHGGHFGIATQYQLQQLLLSDLVYFFVDQIWNELYHVLIWKEIN